MGRICAIIVAAGRGKRMGASINKQYLNIKDKPVLYYTLNAFSKCRFIDEIIIVTSEQEIDFCRDEVVERYGIEKVSKIVAGGSERQHSVYNGLIAAGGTDIVLIHDGARPFVDNTIIENGIKYAQDFGASACGVSPKDTIKIRNEEGFSVETPDRKSLFSVQTPQCFNYDLILYCHNKLQQEGISVTDDTMVVERYGHRVYLYEGSYNNIKITTPEDLVIGEKILDNNLPY